MRLRFLGKETQGGGSPTLFDTDEIVNGKEVYVIQGWRITDPETLAQLDIPDHETVIAVPKALMSHLPEETPHGATEG
ncbi:hypothetical protein [Sphaerisporangium corydalis]|uniref:Ubiquitin-like domain-containing protein n=1 Tax=Sphaerisporangium corydalis TaxID=1441875 RepID=A0ABV9EFQ1_9ACTN|nr:hypothetical protein [Sphaerisporangium corydalis]